MKNNSRLLDKKLNKRHTDIVKMILNGDSLVKIAKKYGVTRQRIQQISARYKLKSPKAKFEINNKITNAVFGSLVENGIDPAIIRSKLAVSYAQVSEFLRYGVDLRVKGSGAYMKDCDKFCYDLYMQGNLAHEIVNMYKEKYDVTKNVGDIYIKVKRHIKSDRLPKRESKRTIYSKKLDEEITKLFKRNRTDEKITNQLIKKGFKNVNGGELNTPTITWRIDKKLKLR